jgi:hypothetical protein
MLPLAGVGLAGPHPPSDHSLREEATMATTATQFPTTSTEGPFGAQGQRPGAGLPRVGELATSSIERETARWPSSTFLWAALGAAGASLLMRSANQKQASRFLGQLVSPLVLFGVYKLANRR